MQRRRQHHGAQRGPPPGPGTGRHHEHELPSRHRGRGVLHHRGPDQQQDRPPHHLRRVLHHLRHHLHHRLQRPQHCGLHHCHVLRVRQHHVRRLRGGRHPGGRLVPQEEGRGHGLHHHGPQLRLRLLCAAGGHPDRPRVHPAQRRRQCLGQRGRELLRRHRPHRHRRHRAGHPGHALHPQHPPGAGHQPRQRVRPGV